MKGECGIVGVWGRTSRRFLRLNAGLGADGVDVVSGRYWVVNLREVGLTCTTR